MSNRNERLDGYRAFFEGAEDWDNPHASGTVEWSQWRDGWDAAADDFWNDRVPEKC